MKYFLKHWMLFIVISGIAGLSSCGDDGSEVTPTALEAAFDANAGNVVVGGTIQFNDASLGTPDSWEWAFEGGTPATSTAQSPTVTYNEVGSFAVTLTISRNGETHTATLNNAVKVEAAFVTDFSTSHRLSLPGNTVTFSPNVPASLAGANLTWTFEGGTPSTSSDLNPQVTFDSYGEFKVSLTASSDLQTQSSEVESAVAVLPTDIVAYFPLNGNLTDFAGNITGTGSPTYAADKNGNAGKALNLNGPNVAFANFNPQTHTNEMTIALWMKPTKDMNSSTSREVFTVQGWGTHQCYYQSGRVSFEVYSAAPRTVKTYSVQMDMTQGQWYYVVLTVKSGEAAHIYVDGTDNELAASPATLQNDIKTLEIGASYGPNYTGVVDEVIYMNRAITADEVSFLMNTLPASNE